MKISRFLILALFTIGASMANAQFSLNNTAEYTLGNIPGQDPSDVHGLYNQLNLRYKLNGFGVSSRIETYQSSFDQREDYLEFTQYKLFYKNNGFNLQAGHFYETLGRGLLFRGYEIKGSVFESQVYRVKQGFYRDLYGFGGAYVGDKFTVKAIRGKSLINELPPFASENRLDLVSAGELNFNIGKQTIGGIYLNNKNSGEVSEYISLLAGGDIGSNFSYYGELAHRINSGESLFDFNEGDSYGIYFSVNYATGGFGASFEVKDYQNLFIGSGISDPPTLVKEHSYRLLNRSTHVPYLFDESGLQVELFYLPADNHVLTFNHSRSKNEFSESTSLKSAEYFLEWHYTANSGDQLKVYTDYSFDDVLAETGRLATGVYFTKVLPQRWSVSFESEFQHLEREFAEKNTYQNLYAGIIISKSTKFSTALVYEFSNDNKFVDLAATDEVETKQHYPGVNFSYKPNRSNTIQLFAGKRRGGPACTSGICYEVLDFKGVELKWSIRL